MKKNFLHICLSESWGGLEMAVTKWNLLLHEHGHNNLNICTPKSPLAEDLKQRALPLVEWDSAHYFAPDFTWKLRKLIEEKNIDVVILQNLRDLWIVSPALYKRPNVQLVGFAQMLLGVKKTDFLHKKVYQRLNHLLTLTDWQVEALMPNLPVPREKYKTIPNFVNSTSFHPKLRDDNFRYQLGFKKEDFVIGIIGRIDEQKGQMELLQAFRKISPKFGSAHLMIIGEPTRGEEKHEKYFEKLRRIVAENKLDKKVHFIGFQNETQKFFANFDLFVLPSYRETFGFVVVESMACGTPVLGTRAGGVPEILRNGDCGFLCEPKDHDSIAKQLEIILSNPQLRQEKAEKALAHCRNFYDRYQVYERFIKIILSS